MQFCTINLLSLVWAVYASKPTSTRYSYGHRLCNAVMITKSPQSEYGIHRQSSLSYRRASFRDGEWVVGEEGKRPMHGEDLLDGTLNIERQQATAEYGFSGGRGMGDRQKRLLPDRQDTYLLYGCASINKKGKNETRQNYCSWCILTTTLRINTGGGNGGGGTNVIMTR